MVRNGDVIQNELLLSILLFFADQIILNQQDMYVPRYFSANGNEEIIAFMKQYAFATIVTVNDNIPVATHLPFTVTRQEDALWLSAHFARANTQWNHIGANTNLVIFSEPHAYISPSHYDREQSVPTWNYIAVHAYGQAEIIHDAGEVLAGLEQMIVQHEPDYLTRWKGLENDYKMKMLRGIVAFRIRVTDLQASYKLSQNKTFSEQERIIGTLSKSDHETERDIAGYMARRLV